MARSLPQPAHIITNSIHIVVEILVTFGPAYAKFAVSSL